MSPIFENYGLLQHYFKWILNASVRGSFSVEFEFETSGCNYTITTSPYLRLAAIFLQPLFSNYLFIYANSWREARTCGCKKITTSPYQTTSNFLVAISLELKLNRETLPLMEINNTLPRRGSRTNMLQQTIPDHSFRKKTPEICINQDVKFRENIILTQEVKCCEN